MQQKHVGWCQAVPFGRPRSGNPKNLAAGCAGPAAVPVSSSGGRRMQQKQFRRPMDAAEAVQEADGCDGSTARSGRDPHMKP